MLSQRTNRIKMFRNQNVETLKPLKLHAEEVHVYDAVQYEENPVETNKTH